MVMLLNSQVYANILDTQNLFLLYRIISFIPKSTLL